jgi:hypothetical protein
MGILGSNMMSSRLLLTCLFTSVVFLGCEDSGSHSGNGAAVDTGVSVDLGNALDDLGSAQDARTAVMPTDMFIMSPPEPAYVEVRLNPRKSLYTLGDNPVIEVTAFDRIGRVIPHTDTDIRIDVQPVAQAEIGPDNRLTFLMEGPGAVRGCATPDLCGRASFFVDDAPPTLEIIEPARAASLTGEPVILVRGRTDPGGQVRVFVNDLPVETDEEGQFQTTLRAEFGLNLIDVIADDGVRRPATRSVREVLWSPVVLPTNDHRIELSEVAILRMHQRVLDTQESPDPPDADGVQRIPDFAGTIEALLARSNLYSLLSNPQIADGEDFNMRIESVTNGTPDVTILLTDTGFEIFLRLQDLAMVTSGQLEIEGEQVQLEGQVELTVAGFASAEFVINADGIPGLVMGDVGLAVERLTGTFNDSTAQAVVDTVGSIVRRVINGAANELVRDLVADEVPDFIELGIDDILEPLRRIELRVEPDDILPGIDLTMSFLAARPRFVRRDRLELIINAAIEHPEAIQAPHPSPGIPDFPEDAMPVWPPSNAVTIALRLSILNAITEAAWHQGAFRLDLSAAVPDGFPQISEMQVDARLPPFVVAAPPGSPHLLQLQFGEIDVFVQNPLNESPDHYVMSLRGGVGLQLGDGRVDGEVNDDLDVRFELLAAGGDVPPLGPQLFETLVAAQIGPQISEALGDILSFDLDQIQFEGDAFDPLNSDINTIHMRPYFPTAPTVQNGWLVIGANVVTEIR